jgi:hypothetical protein
MCVHRVLANDLRVWNASNLRFLLVENDEEKAQLKQLGDK